MLEKVRSILDINNPFYQFGKKLLYVFFLNIIFIVTCIPVVTAGVSMTAMNSVFLKIINEREFSVFRDYFKSFKENFVKATVIWLIALVAGAILYLDIWYWAASGMEEGTYRYVMLALSSVGALFFVMLLHTVFPIISRFEMGYRELIVNTFLITVKNILYVIEAVAFTVLIVGTSIYMIVSGRLLFMVYMILICFGLNGLVQSYIYRRVLNQYSEDYVEMVKRVQEDLKKEGYYDDEP